MSKTAEPETLDFKSIAAGDCVAVAEYARWASTPRSEQRIIGRVRKVTNTLIRVVWTYSKDMEWAFRREDGIEHGGLSSYSHHRIERLATDKEIERQKAGEEEWARNHAYQTSEVVVLAKAIAGDKAYDSERFVPLGVERLRQIAAWLDEAKKPKS